MLILNLIVLQIFLSPLKNEGHNVFNDEVQTINSFTLSLKKVAAIYTAYVGCAVLYMPSSRQIFNVPKMFASTIQAAKSMMIYPCNVKFEWMGAKI